MITEKATHLSERYNAYSFEVNLLATKTEIKEAIETLFNVKVQDVRTQNRRGKPRRYRLKIGCMRRLAEGHRHTPRGIPDRLLLIRHVLAVRPRTRQCLSRASRQTAKRTNHDGYSHIQTDQPRAAQLVGQRLRRADRQEQEAREEPDRAAQEDRAAGTTRVSSPPVTAAAATSGSTGSSTGGATIATASPRPSRISSTTRIDRPGSRWSGTRTARSGISWPPMA